MEPSNFNSFMEAFTTLVEVFNQECSEQAYLIYFEDLSDLPLPSVLNAIRKARQTQVFFPKPVELRKLAGAPETCSPSPEYIKDLALISWDSLRRLSGTAFNEEALSDPITMRVFKQMGGRRYFGTWDYVREEAWKKREFVELYIAYTRCQTLPAQLPQRAAQMVLEQVGLIPKKLSQGDHTPQSEA
jgi:hypothetical protein